jgi:hypothetical protein
MPRDARHKRINGHCTWWMRVVGTEGTVGDKDAKFLDGCDYVTARVTVLG